MSVYKLCVFCGELPVVSRKALNALLRRRKDYGVILECVGEEGSILSEVVVCAMSRGLEVSPKSIISRIHTLARNGVLKTERLGKYVIVTKNVGK